MKADFDGFGIFVFKSLANDAWSIAGVFNRGMTEFQFNSLELTQGKQHTCSIIREFLFS